MSSGDGRGRREKRPRDGSLLETGGGGALPHQYSGDSGQSALTFNVTFMKTGKPTNQKSQKASNLGKKQHKTKAQFWDLSFLT